VKFFPHEIYGDFLESSASLQASQTKFNWNQTILVSSCHVPHGFEISKWCQQLRVSLYHLEDTTDIIGVPYFAAVIDYDFISGDGWSSLCDFGEQVHAESASLPGCEIPQVEKIRDVEPTMIVLGKPGSINIPKYGHFVFIDPQNKTAASLITGILDVAKQNSGVPDIGKVRSDTV